MEHSTQWVKVLLPNMPDLPCLLIWIKGALKKTRETRRKVEELMGLRTSNFITKPTNRLPKKTNILQLKAHAKISWWKVTKLFSLFQLFPFSHHCRKNKAAKQDNLNKSPLNQNFFNLKKALKITQGKSPMAGYIQEHADSSHWLINTSSNALFEF